MILPNLPTSSPAPYHTQYYTYSNKGPHSQHTLTGVVSGVASTAASGGDVLLRPPVVVAAPMTTAPGVDWVDLISWDNGVACSELGGGGLWADTTMLGDQNDSRPPLARPADDSTGTRGNSELVLIGVYGHE